MLQPRHRPEGRTPGNNPSFPERLLYWLPRLDLPWPKRYAMATAVVAAVALLRALLDLGGLPFLPFIPGLMWASFALGLGAGLYATLLSAVVAAVFFLAPPGSFALTSDQWVSLIAFTLIDVVIAIVCSALSRTLSAREASIAALARAQAELQALNETLERRIEERTRERDRLWILSRDAFLITDVEGRWLRVSPAWSTLLGWSEAELLGRTSAWMEHPDDPVPDWRVLDTGAAGPMTLRFENRFRTKDGSWRWFSWTAVPADGLYYCVARDVTTEREQAEALRQAEEALRQSQKMEAVGQLTGGIAHDFNNLLTAITGSLGLLRTRLRQGRPEAAERYIATAEGASERAAALTNRLLAFSRRQTLDPRPTDINRLVTGMIELVRRTVGPAIAVETSLPDGIWATLVDSNQLENAVLNLCINARDAMPGGGRLHICTANRILDMGAARECDLAPGEYVTVTVADTGVGMSPEVSSRAFDPFFTTKPIGQGTGLGLSMIYGFARQSGGQARILSEPGRGTRVEIYLPRYFGPLPMEESGAARLRTPRDGAGQTILLVEDEDAVRSLAAEILQDRGYTVLEAPDGAAGVAMLRSGVRPDLLVTDVGLPGGTNGRQVADAARAEQPGLSVLFITGYAEKEVLGDGPLGRGFFVLVKPFPMERLVQYVGDILTRTEVPSRAG
ncbi:ATP-binding protein [Roseomonas chloroacetimidivorans]|jgi:PAS domain S-box-containing protein|uniref:ATP-binding protein n=1 Tax=Roseomonas chloroacetimidivorans TaxID=1766656 RepID=UPI003C720F9D